LGALQLQHKRRDRSSRYSFPIAPYSAVHSFTAEFGGKKIIAELKENEEAQNTYDDAISAGHGAFSGQQHSQNVFTALVGNLAHLPAAERFKFYLPSRLAPIIFIYVLIFSVAIFMRGDLRLVWPILNCHWGWT